MKNKRRRGGRLQRIEAAKADAVIAFDASVEIRAAKDGESKGPRRFDVLAYTGGELQVGRYPLPVVIDLQGLEAAKSIVANLHHVKENIVGHVTEHTNDGKQLLLAGLVSGTGESAAEFLGNGDNGYPWGASVEVQPTIPPEQIKAGQSVTVNGQRFNGPIFVARKSRLYGVAFLPRPADENSTVKIAAGAAQTEETSMFEAWLIEAGFVPAELSDTQKAVLQKQYDAEIKASKKSPPADDKNVVVVGNEFDLSDIKASALASLNEIEVIFANHENDSFEAGKFAEIQASGLKLLSEVKANAISEQWSGSKYEIEAARAVNAIELQLIRAGRAKAPAAHIVNREVTGGVIEAALCNGLGLDVEKQFDDKTMQAAHSNYRNLGLKETLILAARANGYNGRESVNLSNLREVLTHAFSAPIHASSFSSVSLSGILSNVANKSLLSGFMEEDQTWREFAEVVPVSDFKTSTRYRMLDDMEYEQLGPNGEIAHAKVGEESYTHSADTYAKMFAITRTMIINDDLGALDDIRTRLGRGAARKFRRLFWLTFMNNGSFFTSARGNYISGAGSNLLVDGVALESAITKYRKMKSGDKKQVGTGGSSIGAPTKLLLPPEKEFVGNKLYTGANLSTTQDDNIHQGKYVPHVVNELSDSDYTNYSTVKWYLFGGVLKPVVVSFLNGQQNPTVESADADFNQLGIQLRGYHDFGVDLSEYLSGVANKGSA